MDQSLILAEISSTASRLTGVLRSIPLEQFDQVPFEGSWTAGETGEHILKSSTYAADLLRGKTAPAGRDAGQMIPVLRDILLNFNTRMNAPANLEPREQIHPKEGLIHSLQHTFDTLVAAAAALDPQVLCLDFELPGLGAITRIEWCAFLLFHTQRHLHQLEGIAQRLNEKVAASV